MPCKVLICGLGRGGTSSVASLLYHVGFNLSGEDQPNTKFEDDELRELLLKSELTQLADRLESRAITYPLTAWKDPKLFASQGLELVRRLPIDWTVIAVFRDPVAIVARRVSMHELKFSEDMPKVIKATRKLHNFCAAAEKAGNEVIYVSYEKLMMDPLKTIDVLVRKLGISIAKDQAAEIWAHMQENQKMYLAEESDLAKFNG
jgi:hypothetical protein